jgi:hypothetical protein
MVIITKNARYIAFPSRKSDCSIAFANITSGGWTGSIPEVFVEKIYDLITDGESELLWSQEWNKEITMSEIAEKFSIPVEHLRIKKE